MSRKNGKPSAKKEKDFSRKIYKILAKDPNKSFNYKQIAAILELTDTKSRNEIIKELKLLASQEQIEETDRGKYKVIAKADYVEGTIDMTSRKTAYFVSPDIEDDVFLFQHFYGIFHTSQQLF